MNKIVIKKSRLKVVYGVFLILGWLAVGIGYSIPIINWNINFLICCLGIIAIIISIIMLVKIGRR